MRSKNKVYDKHVPNYKKSETFGTSETSKSDQQLIKNLPLNFLKEEYFKNLKILKIILKIKVRFIFEFNHFKNPKFSKSSQVRNFF